MSRCHVFERITDPDRRQYHDTYTSFSRQSRNYRSRQHEPIMTAPTRLGRLTVAFSRSATCARQANMN